MGDAARHTFHSVCRVVFSGSNPSVRAVDANEMRLDFSHEYGTLTAVRFRSCKLDGTIGWRYIETGRWRVGDAARHTFHPSRRVPFSGSNPFVRAVAANEMRLDFARATYGPGQRGVDHLIRARDIIDAEIKRRVARSGQAEKETEDEDESITVLVYGSALPVRVAVLACAGWDTEFP